ncbi:MAG: hemolysin III family protein [Verrucomicrobiota bacterium]
MSDAQDHQRRQNLRHRKQSFRRRISEEAANTIIHFAGLILSIIGSIILLNLAIPTGDPWRIISAIIYGLSLISLFGASTLYHFTANPRRKYRLRLWDHNAIYFLIAGSYTPFLLVTLRGPWGWSLLTIIWSLALAGFILKTFISHKANRRSTALYLAMGWLAIVAAKPLYDSLQTGGIILLVAGGLAYTAGTWFFARDFRPFYHAIWHLFVLAGAACHFLAIARYVIPGAS